MKIFGFDLFKKEEKALDEPLKSPIADMEAEEGYFIETAGLRDGITDMTDSSSMRENDLINQYRSLSLLPEVDRAISEIVNELLVINPSSDFPVSIDIEGKDIAAGIKKKIIEEFKTVQRIMDFKRNGNNILRRFYIDGRIRFHLVVDDKAKKDGIKEIRMIDPRKIKRVVEIQRSTENDMIMTAKADEYFTYNSYITLNRGFNSIQQTIKVDRNLIASANSGVFVESEASNRQIPISHLQSAIKVANQLNMIEDSSVIYKLSRAPERRAFYVDTGNLPKQKAEQYVLGMMQKFQNKMVYDTTTGKVKDAKNVMSILEDFWLPRKEGNRGTEIQTLPGGTGLGSVDEILYFQQKLYKALKIPISRLEPDKAFTLGRSSEISREEIKFQKFIESIRSRFEIALLDMIRTQCVLKNIITLQEFKEFLPRIKFQWDSDSYWDELKETEMWNTRFSLLQTIDPFIGRFVDPEWVMKNVLKFDDEEIGKMIKKADSAPDEPTGEEPPANKPPEDKPIEPMLPGDPGDPGDKKNLEFLDKTPPGV
jgi:hypothetical protein